MMDGFPADDDLELLDPDGPHPDIHSLFVHYRDLYFSGGLGGVSVEWSSKRMTSCGGTCQRVPGGAIIKLSLPLLSLRPSRDLKMVLLHEMIHAHCMVEGIRDPDPSGHGPPFQTIMHQINNATCQDLQRPAGGYNISVYHTMIDEVNFYRQHQWKCERCGVEVHRAMNRKPQEADCRQRAGAACQDVRCNWHMHLKTCGGEYVKIKEPEDYGQKKSKKKAKSSNGDNDGTGVGESSSIKDNNNKISNKGQPPITAWFKDTGDRLGSSSGQISTDLRTGGNDRGSTLSSITAVLDNIGHSRGPAPITGADGSSLQSNHSSAVEEGRKLFEAAALRRVQQSANNHIIIGGEQNNKNSKNPTGSTEATVIHKPPFENNTNTAIPSPSEVIDLLNSDNEENDKIFPGSITHPNNNRNGGAAEVPTMGNTYMCPVCNAALPADNNAAINTHLDSCLNTNV